MEESRYDIYIEEEQICLENSSSTTKYPIYIKELNKKIIANIPYSIMPKEMIRLKGAGKKITNTKNGNLYISFKKVYVEKIENTTHLNSKYTYKFIKGISEIELEEEINKWAQDNWRCVSVQPKIWNSSIYGEDIQNLSISPDYEYDIILEKIKN